jgi:hypothetical protein
MRFYRDSDGVRLVYRKRELRGGGGHGGRPRADEVEAAREVFVREEAGRRLAARTVARPVASRNEGEVVPVIFVGSPWLDLLVMGRVKEVPVPPRWMAGARGLVALFASRNVDGLAVERMEGEGLARVEGMVREGVAAVAVAGGGVDPGAAGEFMPTTAGRCFLGLERVRMLRVGLGKVGWKMDGSGQRVGIRTTRERLLGLVGEGEVEEGEECRSEK